MAGEMSASEVTREAYPLHFAIADAFGGEVCPFDQYQGPYVLVDGARLFLGADAGGAEYVWNERTQKHCNFFFSYNHDALDCSEAVSAAEAVLGRCPNA